MPVPNPYPIADGQESVWDYPRPPRLEPDIRRVVVRFGGTIIADSTQCWRVLETGHPPVFYIPPEDVMVELLRVTARTSTCEFKGDARYYDIVVGDRVAEVAAWCYPEPKPAFEHIQHAIAFYANQVDSATVGAEPVTAQPGDYYGGWITQEIIGPFKGEPGSDDW